MSDTGPPRKEGLLEEAAAWFARMRGPEAEESREEFERWLARGALHRSAYNRAAEVFAMGKVLAEDPGQTEEAPARDRGRDARLVIATAAVTLLAASTAGLVVYRSTAMRGPVHQSVASTVSAAGQNVTELAASGEPQLVRLSDNSRVRLARGAMIAVNYGAGERKLLLERGSARFFVAHEKRPFIVLAGGGSVVAHGTVFDVGLGTNRRVNVRLIEGVIDVTPPRLVAEGRPAAPPKILHAGEALTFDGTPQSGATEAAVQPKPTPGDQPATAAAQARDFDNVPLSEVTRLANEGAARPIRFADPTIGSLRISGFFRIDDTELLARRLSSVFDLRVDSSNPSQLVLTRK